MTTTIQISNKLQSFLAGRRVYERESYEEIIWDLIEDTMELSDQTKKDLEVSMQQIKEGKYHTLEEVRRINGL